VRKDLNKYSVVLNFGVTVISNIIVGTLIGYYIDKWTFKNGVFLIVFVLLGIASGLYNGFKYLLKEADKYDKHDKEDDNKRDDSGIR